MSKPKNKPAKEPVKKETSCFTCDGTGKQCDICGETPNACECEDEGEDPTFSACKDCNGTGK